jgi:hypothetical protein
MTVTANFLVRLEEQGLGRRRPFTIARIIALSCYVRGASPWMDEPSLVFLEWFYLCLFAAKKVHWVVGSIIDVFELGA